MLCCYLFTNRYSSLGRRLRNTTVGHVLSRGKNATRRGFSAVGTGLASGARRVGSVFRSGYRRRVFSQDRYRNFIDRLTNNLESGDNETIIMLDRLGIQVSVNEDGQTQTAVRDDSRSTNQILQEQGFYTQQQSSAENDVEITKQQSSAENDVQITKLNFTTVNNGVDLGLTNLTQSESTSKTHSSTDIYHFNPTQRPIQTEYTTRDESQNQKSQNVVAPTTTTTSAPRQNVVTDIYQFRPTQRPIQTEYTTRFRPIQIIQSETPRFRPTQRPVQTEYTTRSRPTQPPIKTEYTTRGEPEIEKLTLRTTAPSYPTPTTPRRPLVRRTTGKRLYVCIY